MVKLILLEYYHRVIELEKMQTLVQGWAPVPILESFLQDPC